MPALMPEGSRDELVVPRSAWAERDVRLLPLIPGRRIRHTWVHHTRRRLPGGAASDEAAERAFMRDLEDYHVDTRGFRAVGYSFVIMPGGRTYEGRGWGMLGAHTLRRNGNSYGIALVGNFDEDQPTPEALSACLALIRLGIEGGHLSGTDHPTGGHGDVADTPCPGVNLTSWLRGARAELRPSR